MELSAIDERASSDRETRISGSGIDDGKLRSRYWISKMSAKAKESLTQPIDSAMENSLRS